MTKNIRLTIGEFSRFCQVTVKTLRHYERLKLLVPHEVDEWTGYRYYNVSQMQQLNAILRLKEMGFSLEDVRDLFDEGTHKPSIKQVEAKIKQTEELILTLEKRLKILRRVVDTQTLIESTEKIYTQSLPSIIVASHRHVLAHRKDLTPLCADVIGPAIQLTGCRRTLPMYSFNVEYEKEYKTENIDIEYCEQVEEMILNTELITSDCPPSLPLSASNATGRTITSTRALQRLSATSTTTATASADSIACNTSRVPGTRKTPKSGSPSSKYPSLPCENPNETDRQ